MLAEGPRGSIAKYLIPKLGMNEGRNPQTYAKEAQRIPELQRQLDESAAEVERLYARWQELQDKTPRQ